MLGGIVENKAIKLTLLLKGCLCISTFEVTAKTFGGKHKSTSMSNRGHSHRPTDVKEHSKALATGSKL
jgi:hypothetical protein